jgi:replication initiation and membrane attachment protein DnaB
MPKYVLPQPHRVRKIEGSFAWLDHRLVRNGYLPVMTQQDQSLYLFLVLAADRHGVSFYRKEKICEATGLDFQQFEVAKDRLISLGLIAFQSYSVLSPNGFYQVLPVDAQPPAMAPELSKLLQLKSV